MSNKTLLSITPARTPEDLATIRAFFTAYASSLPIDLAFQSFQVELDSLPGRYSVPDGEILLAYANFKPVGCIALRPLSGECCEMKRLYVAPEGRGMGVGRALVQTIVKLAVEKGYAEMKLDTLSSMEPALALYRSVGFVDIGAYYETPILETVFMSLMLEPSSDSGKV
jgi:ribosomal protein S18 acetylase RimI-like enzyme